MTTAVAPSMRATWTSVSVSKVSATVGAGRPELAGEPHPAGLLVDRFDDDRVAADEILVHVLQGGPSVQTLEPAAGGPGTAERPTHTTKTPIAIHSGPPSRGNDRGAERTEREHQQDEVEAHQLDDREHTAMPSQPTQAWSDNQSIM